MHLHRGRDTHSFSLSEIPLVLGLVVLEPGLLVVARVIGAGVVLVVARRQRRIKLGFNLAHLLVEVSLAAVVFNAIADAEMSVTDAWTWIAAYAAAATTHLYGWIAISAVISISEAELQLADIRSTLTAGAGAVVMNTSLAVLGVIASDANRLALVPVIVLAAMSAVSYRSYSVLRRGHGRLEMLYDFTGALGHTVVLEEAVSVVLSEARTALRAAQAGVVWVDEQSGAATMWWLADGKAQRRLLSIDETETSWWSPVLSGDCIAPSSPKQRRGRCREVGTSRWTGGTTAIRAPHRRCPDCVRTHRRSQHVHARGPRSFSGIVQPCSGRTRQRTAPRNQTPGLPRPTHWIAKPACARDCNRTGTHHLRGLRCLADHRPRWVQRCQRRARPLGGRHCLDRGKQTLDRRVSPTAQRWPDSAVTSSA